MKIYPIIYSMASINSFMLAFTKPVLQLVNVTSNSILAINAQTGEIDNMFPFELAIQLSTPLVQDGKNYVIIQQKQQLVKLRFENGQIYTDLLYLNPTYAICASSNDFRSVVFIDQQRMCFFGEFASSNDKYLFNAPRCAVFGYFGLAVLYSDSLHQVWVYCIKGEKISPPQQVQEDIWHIVGYYNYIIGFGNGISSICDPWVSKLQSFVLQNGNVMAAVAGFKEGEFYISDCLGSLILVETDGKYLTSSCTFTASQANSLTFLRPGVLFLGSRSGDSLIFDLTQKLVAKRFPSLAPIHDICELDGKVYLATGMEKTGSFKSVRKILKAAQLRRIDMELSISRARVLYSHRNTFVFELLLEDESAYGSVVFCYENGVLRYIDYNHQIDMQMSRFTYKFVVSLGSRLVLAYVDDYTVRFCDFKGKALTEVRAQQLAEGQRIIYCQTSPSNAYLVLTLTGNFVCLLDAQAQPQVLSISIDEIQQQLLQAAVSDAGVLALLFDQVPYVILYENEQTAFQNIDYKSLLEQPPDIDLFYLLAGGIPPNNTRPALIARLVDGRMVACPFSSDACYLSTGVVALRFLGNYLIVGHRSGEVGVYDVDGLHCRDYSFYRFAGLRDLFFIGDEIFALDAAGRQFVVDYSAVEVFDGAIFGCAQASADDGVCSASAVDEEPENTSESKRQSKVAKQQKDEHPLGASDLKPSYQQPQAEGQNKPGIGQIAQALSATAQRDVIYFGYDNTDLLLLTQTHKTYAVESRGVHALARAVCSFYHRYIATAAVRAQELTSLRISQAQKAILTPTGHLSAIESANTTPDVEDVAATRRLTSILQLRDESGAEVASLELENAYVTQIVSCHLAKYPREFLAVAALMPQDSEAESGFVAVYSFDGCSLTECGRFTARRGIYHLVAQNRRLLAGNVENLIVLDLLGSASQFAPLQTHGTPDGLFEVGFVSTCVFITSLATGASAGWTVFSDLAKGVFIGRVRGELRGRAEVVGLRRLPGKGAVGIFVDFDSAGMTFGGQQNSPLNASQQQSESADENQGTRLGKKQDSAGQGSIQQGLLSGIPSVQSIKSSLGTASPRFLICSPEGKVQLWADGVVQEERDIGAQILVLRATRGGWLYGCSNGELGRILITE